MKSLSIFCCLLVPVIFLTDCGHLDSSAEYIPGDSLKLYLRRDSLVNIVEAKVNEEAKQTGTVVWQGEDDCRYLIIKTEKWYIVAENNYVGGIYKTDQIKGNFPEYGNTQAYNLTTESTVNLFIINEYATQNSAMQFVKRKCRLDNVGNNY